MKEITIAQKILELAKKSGAEKADAFIQASAKFSAEVREGKVDRLSQADSKGLGLRVFKNNTLGFACTTDFSDEALINLADKAVQLAAVSSPNPANDLPCAEPVKTNDLMIYDETIAGISAETKINLALEAETAMFDTDDKIVNTHGCQCETNITRIIIANTNGILNHYQSTICSIVAIPIAAQGEEMQIAYDYTVGRYFNDMLSAKEIGKQAALKAVAKLGAVKVKTQQAPVIFDRRAASNILRGLFDAIDGDAASRNRSFLRDKLGEKIAPDFLCIYDDGLAPKGLGTAPCDDEGIPMQRTPVIQNGVLTQYLYDFRTAKKLGVKPTGNSQRSYSSTPDIGPTNFFIAPGKRSLDELIGSVSNGFYVTDIMGHGLDPVSGDMSFGASGLWIENGKPTHAVEEVTVASHLTDMLNALEEIGSDFIMENNVVSPSLLIGKMTISGS